MEQREWRFPRIERLHGQMEHDALVLPIEYSMTGLRISATTSRMMWMDFRLQPPQVGRPDEMG